MYQIYYIPGSGGSFLDGVVSAYHNNKRFRLEVDPDSGHCHKNKVGSSNHFIVDGVNPVIFVKPDSDDFDFISDMYWTKYNKQWLCENEDYARYEWDWYETIDFTDDLELKSTAHIVFKEAWNDEWLENTMSENNFDLVIPFKTIFGLDSSNLNNMLSDYFKTPARVDIGHKILEYQKINKEIFKEEISLHYN